MILLPQPIHVILIVIIHIIVIHVIILVIIVIVATNEIDNPNVWDFQSMGFYTLNPLWVAPCCREV
jgi:hypothetical protein